MPASKLVGHWVHSHEEDTDTEMVFRPANFAFPRSRGRISFELKADGSMVDHGIGAGDAATETRGTWSQPSTGVLAFIHGTEKKPARKLKIIRAEHDRLVMEK